MNNPMNNPMNNSRSSMNAPPEDDPFAALGAKTTTEKELVSPLEFGSGAVDPAKSPTKPATSAPDLTAAKEETSK